MCGFVDNAGGGLVGANQISWGCGWDEWCIGPYNESTSIPGTDFGKAALCSKGERTI